MPMPTYTIDQIAYELTHEHWGGRARYFDVAPGGSLSVNLTALNSTGVTLARAALEAWENVIDVTFVETTGSADVTMDHNSGGAVGGHSYTIYSGAEDYTITSAYVSISTGWFNSNHGTTIGSYSMQTFIHEIGHALGLGHAGEYDHGSDYGIHNHYTNDSWQMSVMSYFDQQENTSIDASKAFTATLMIADIVAAQQFYGASSAQAGNTVYGFNSNVGGYLEDIFDSAFDPGTGNTQNAFTLYDAGGVDLINLRHEDADQNIDLNAEAISDIGGLTGNLIIARDTVIENARTGGGNDGITGNSADNNLRGYGGEDTITGGDGDDILRGNGGKDDLSGGAGNDVLYGGSSRDFMAGGADDDRLRGEAGNDTLDGGSGNDRLRGEDGRDVLDGGDGQDRLRGGADDDVLNGGNGNDSLWGESGQDTLAGGDGADTFLFTIGNDRILDFMIGQDMLHIDRALFTDGLSNQQVLDTYASSGSAGTTFDFQNGSSLQLDAITDPDSLLGSLEFF